MQKIAKLLEKYVEWIVMGIGALFLLWMIYDNVIEKPVSVPLAGQQSVSPGDVDQIIVDGPVTRIDREMQNPNVPPMPVQDFLTDLQKRIGTDPSALAGLNVYWTGYLQAPTVSSNPQEINAPVPMPVTGLPVAPAAVDLQFSQDRSQVLKPTPLGAAGGGAGVNPANAGTPTDCNWVSISASIDTQKLDAEFTKVNIPARFRNTTVLRIILTRQEQNSAGQWGSETIVPPLSNMSLMDLPANNANVNNQQLDYVKWAQNPQIQADLLQPPFYQVVTGNGNPWRLPGTLPPQPVVVEPPFDPATFNGDSDKLPPDQKAQYDAYKKARQHRTISPRPTGGPGVPPQFGGPPGVPGYSGGYNPNPPPAPRRAATPTTPTPTPMVPPPGYAGPYQGMPGYPMPGMPGGMPVPQNTIPAGAIPQGAFNPANQPKFLVWAHDDTVEPGKTYRYKITYVIESPVFQTFNVCKNQADANQFSIQSADSDWTPAINVQSETNFFLVQTAPTQSIPKATFVIFRWQNGGWQKQQEDVRPGDMIGSVRGEGANRVDFTTGWTLVDVLDDPRNQDNKIVILTGNTGQMYKRDRAADLANPEYQRLNDLVNAAASSAAAGNPVPSP